MIISINNQKGGIGKTTTVQSIGAGLSQRGFKVLLIDLDPQGNLTYSTGADGQGITIYEVMKGSTTLSEGIQHLENFDIIPANILLSGADIEFTFTGREHLLKEAIGSLKNPYDFILIDTPPSLGILTVNALTVSDKVIIPLTADIFSLQGLGQLHNTINRVRKYSNPNLQVEGLLLTKFNDRTILNREIRENIEKTAKEFNSKLFTAAIRESISMREAQAYQTDIFKYAPGSNPAKDYEELINELIGGTLNHGEERI